MATRPSAAECVVLLALASAACQASPGKTRPSSNTPEFGGPASTSTRVYREPDSTTSSPVYTVGLVLRHSGAANGTILLTFEHDIHREAATLPIYRSSDDGASWKLVAQVTDTHYSQGLRGQPSLFELPHSVGDLPRGTVLLAASAQPVDQTSTQLVLYKSTDQGGTWTYLSTIDEGGPALYDPSGASITTTVWEPEIYVDGHGDLVVSFSDERHKSRNVLQAIVHRTSRDGGRTWGPLVLDIAPPDRRTRPGMMSVVRLPDGRYLGAYEVVGVPDVPIYARYSRDGQDWGDPTDIGDLVATADGGLLYGSPHLTWVDTGTAEGTLVLSGQRYVTPLGASKSMFLSNAQLGDGVWVPVPQPVQISGSLLSHAGFKQSTAATLDNTRLIQFTTVNNEIGTHDVVTAEMPLGSGVYPASRGILQGGAQRVARSASVSGLTIGHLDEPRDAAVFPDVVAPEEGTYAFRIRYSNGTGSPSRHTLTIDDRDPLAVSYPSTGDWNTFGYATITARLEAGAHTVTVAHRTGFAELDQVEVYPVREQSPARSEL